MATDVAKLHMNQQEAYALLSPFRRDLERMEARVQNYLARLSFQEGDREQMESALTVLAEAHTELARICEEASRR
jgi:hypothetical protein